MPRRSPIHRLQPPLRFSALTVRGDGRGRTIGYPTINLALDQIPETLAHGIYACRVVIEGSGYVAAMHYGPRPVFDAGIAFEVYLIDASLERLPERVTVEVIARLRDIQNFADAKTLSEVIANDVADTRAILAAA